MIGVYVFNCLVESANYLAECATGHDDAMMTVDSENDHSHIGGVDHIFYK